MRDMVRVVDAAADRQLARACAVLLQSAGIRASAMCRLSDGAWGTYVNAADVAAAEAELTKLDTEKTKEISQ